jgi:hypothetical protein
MRNLSQMHETNTVKTLFDVSKVIKSDSSETRPCHLYSNSVTGIPVRGGSTKHTWHTYRHMWHNTVIDSSSHMNVLTYILVTSLQLTPCKNSVTVTPKNTTTLYTQIPMLSALNRHHLTGLQHGSIVQL